MTRFFSLLIGAILLIAMSNDAMAQNPYRGGTGFDGGWGSKRQAVEMSYRGYPANYKTTFLPPAPRYYSQYGGGCGSGYYGGGSGYYRGGTSVSASVSYQSGRGSGFGVGVAVASRNVGVSFVYSSARGGGWGGCRR